MKARLSLLLVGVGLLSLIFFDPLMSVLGEFLSYGQARSVVLAYPARLRQALHGKRFRYVPYAGIPSCARNGIVSVEDKRFFTHSGIDLIAIFRVMGMTVVDDHEDHGGSTLTQQLARLIVREPRNEPTALAAILGLSKIFRYTLIVNHEFTKPEVMELYLNSVFFSRHAQGIAQAAETYFHTDLDDLRLGQCLYLTGLPQAPSAFGQDAMGHRAQQRYRHVLATMVRNHYLSEGATQALKFDGLFYVTPK